MTLKLKAGVTTEPAAPAGDDGDVSAGDGEGAAAAEDTGAEPNKKDGITERLDRLEAENKALKEKLDSQPTTPATPPPPQPSVTSDDLMAMSEDEREKTAEHVGIPFNTILAKVRAQEKARAEYEKQTTVAQNNVRDAIEDMVDSDPRMARYKKHVREFMADIPDSEKADPKRLKRHMDKAVIYAKGVVGSTTKPNASNPKGGAAPDGEPSFEDEDGDIKPGTYEIGNGGKVRIENLVDKETRKRIKHPTKKGGIQIPSDFDQVPRFSK